MQNPQSHSETKSINHPWYNSRKKASNNISTILLAAGQIREEACTRFSRSYRTREREEEARTHRLDGEETLVSRSRSSSRRPLEVGAVPAAGAGPFHLHPSRSASDHQVHGCLAHLSLNSHRSTWDEDNKRGKGSNSFCVESLRKGRGIE